MRKFELCILDSSMHVADRYPLDEVSSPSGLGFSQKVTVVETKTVDYIVEQSVRKKNIKITVSFREPQAYLKTKLFRDWYCKYVKSRVTLKYTDDSMDRYMDVIITDFDVSEIDTGSNSVPMELQPLTPFYVLKQQQVIATITANGKEYTYGYPYSYGGGHLDNNTIENTFFEPAPLRVRLITGAELADPKITLSDADDVVYCEVEFLDLTLAAGDILVVDAINHSIRHYVGSADTVGTDVYNKLNKAKNSFLYAAPGQSTISATMSNIDTTGSVAVTYVQYVL